MLLSEASEVRETVTSSLHFVSTCLRLVLAIAFDLHVLRFRLHCGWGDVAEGNWHNDLEARAKQMPLLENVCSYLHALLVKLAQFFGPCL